MSEIMSGDELLSMLSVQMREIHDGSRKPAVANALVNTGGLMVRMYQLQLKYMIATGQTPAIPGLLPEARKSE